MKLHGPQDLALVLFAILLSSCGGNSFDGPQHINLPPLPAPQPPLGGPVVFTFTGSMAAPRIDHTATLLPNGKVLVVGGFNGNVMLSSAELYDPTVETFSTTGSMNAPRAQHTATLLPTGKVLVVGGGEGGVPLSAELYDPATERFTVTGSMTTGRVQH